MAARRPLVLNNGRSEQLQASDVLEDNGTLFVQTADQTVANTVVETTLIGTGVGSLTIPADFLLAGKTVIVTMRGYLSDTGTPSFTLRVKLGTTTVLTTGLTSTTGTFSDNGFVVEGLITCRTTGAGGTVMAQGTIRQDPNGSTNVLGTGMVNLSPITIDTTVTQTVDITWEWDTADPGDTITSTNLIVRVA